MGFPRPQPVFTIAEYLAMERASQERHIFLDGQILAMAGESDRHGIITVNLVGILHAQLKGTSCQARTKDTKVRSGPDPQFPWATAGLFSYPDVVVACGELEWHDHYTDVLLNPRVIIEVLSESTEDFDRTIKFDRLKEWNPALSDFLLVSQDEPCIEHRRRQGDGSWTCQKYSGKDATVVVASIDCTLPLADEYDRVLFQACEGTPE